MRILRPILILLLIAFIAIQFFRPTKNVSAQTSPNDVTLQYAIPADVKTILKKGCNDCHSNNTVYPWYAQVQPVAWWLEEHIIDGKKELNFSEFASYKPRRQYRKMEEVIKEVKEKEMPLESYTWVHTDAKLNDEERNKIMTWAQGIRDTLESKYPLDSLVAKKK